MGPNARRLSPSARRPSRAASWLRWCHSLASGAQPHARRLSHRPGAVGASRGLRADRFGRALHFLGDKRRPDRTAGSGLQPRFDLYTPGAPVFQPAASDPPPFKTCGNVWIWWAAVYGVGYGQKMASPPIPNFPRRPSVGSASLERAAQRSSGCPHQPAPSLPWMRRHAATVSCPIGRATIMRGHVVALVSLAREWSTRPNARRCLIGRRRRSDRPASSARPNARRCLINPAPSAWLPPLNRCAR
jgi:hypothetical protein